MCLPRGLVGFYLRIKSEYEGKYVRYSLRVSIEGGILVTHMCMDHRTVNCLLMYTVLVCVPTCTYAGRQRWM